MNDVVRQRGTCREVVGAQVREHKRGVPMRLPSVMLGRNSPRDMHGGKGEGLLTLIDDPDLGLKRSEDCCIKTSAQCAVEDRMAWAQEGRCGKQGRKHQVGLRQTSMPSSTSQALNCHQEGKRIWSYSLEHLRSMIPTGLCFSRKVRSLW